MKPEKRRKRQLAAPDGAGEEALLPGAINRKGRPKQRKSHPPMFQVIRPPDRNPTGLPVPPRVTAVPLPAAVMARPIATIAPDGGRKNPLPAQKDPKNKQNFFRSKSLVMVCPRESALPVLSAISVHAILVRRHLLSGKGHLPAW